MLSISLSGTREYLREVLLVADTSPITPADCITLRGAHTLRKAQWNKSPRYPFDFTRAQFPCPSIRIRSASRSSQSRSERISLFRAPFYPLRYLNRIAEIRAADFWSLDTRGKAIEKKSFFIASSWLSRDDRCFWISMRRCGIYWILCTLGWISVCRNLSIDRWLSAFLNRVYPKNIDVKYFPDCNLNLREQTTRERDIYNRYSKIHSQNLLQIS